LARRHGAPIIPVHVSGPFPFYYHAFDFISRELRNLTLFREFLNKAGKRYDLKFGPPIPPSVLASDAEALTQRLRAHVGRVLPKDPDQVFSPAP
jgi:putative hemolysin